MGSLRIMLVRLIVENWQSITPSTDKLDKSDRLESIRNISPSFVRPFITTIVRPFGAHCKIRQKEVGGIWNTSSWLTLSVFTELNDMCWHCYHQRGYQAKHPYILNMLLKSPMEFNWCEHKRWGFLFLPRPWPDTEKSVLQLQHWFN